MRVLVLWASERSANLGVRVLAEGAIALGQRAWGDCEFVCQDFSPSENGFAFSRDVLRSDLGRANGPAKEFLRGFDVILDTGAGDSFTDIYGMRRLLIMAYVQRAAQYLGIPIVQMPQTIGPFDSRLGRRIARRSANRMSLVMSRDHASTEFADSLGITVDLTATDVVFALPQPETSKTRDVVLNVSGLLWHENPHVDAQTYRGALAEVIEKLREAGRSVTLLAHVVDSNSTDNDVPAVRALSAIFRDELEVVIPTDLSHAREALASAKLVIGSRMHACLNALSASTPAIAWSYSRKFAPLLSDVGWEAVVDLKTSPGAAEETMLLLTESANDELAERARELSLRIQPKLDRAVGLLRDMGLGPHGN